MKSTIYEVVAPIVPVLQALVPGAFGAAVAVAVQRGLTWLQRFVQLAVGIVVSYYAGEAASSLFGFDGAVKNGVGFVAGVAAFETVKTLRTSIADVAKDAPRQLWERVMSKLDVWFPPKK